MAISMIYSNVVIEKRIKKKVSDLSEMIKQYMSDEEQSVDVFPAEYSEISTQMAELKINLQKHEQMLKEEVGRKNDLVAYLAHDLNTPLTSVVGYLSLLNEAEDMPHKMQEKYIGITLRKALRLDEARGISTGGAGLGLAIAREIINLHGGSISATSVEGETTFTVYLPTASSSLVKS